MAGTVQLKAQLQKFVLWNDTDSSKTEEKRRM